MVTTQAGVDLELFEYDRVLEIYRSRYDESTTPTSMAVVATLSKATGICPMELEPLGETIDTDALDDIFRDNDRTSRKASVSFITQEHTITVYDSGEITVDPEVEGGSLN